MEETTSVPDDLWTSADHRHHFKIDKDREEITKIWKRQGIFYVRDDYLSWSEDHGYGDLVFLTCTHDRCDFYLQIKKSVFYPTMIDNRDPACVKQWSECQSFAYNPACCRFPKNCSAGYRV